MREYEVLFIINPKKEDSLEGLTSSIKDAINKANGKINKEENWGKQKLSYPIEKETEGIYYKLNFSVDATQISTLNNSYKLNSDILRAMITKK